MGMIVHKDGNDIPSLIQQAVHRCQTFDDEAITENWVTMTLN